MMSNFIGLCDKSIIMGVNILLFITRILRINVKNQIKDKTMFCGPFQ